MYVCMFDYVHACLSVCIHVRIRMYVSMSILLSFSVLSVCPVCLSCLSVTVLSVCPVPSRPVPSCPVCLFVFLFRLSVICIYYSCAMCTAFGAAAESYTVMASAICVFVCLPLRVVLQEPCPL